MLGLNDFFSFNKRERIGITTLLVIIICCISAIPLINNLFETKNKISFDKFSNEIDSFNQINSSIKQKNNYGTLFPVPDSIYQFKFNPNTADTIELLTLGFNPTQTKNLINYRNKGGKFKQAEDLKKLWGMTDSLYSVLEPYIYIPAQTSINYSHNKSLHTTSENLNAKEVDNKREKKKELKININIADTTELKKLKGVGSKLATRIVEFREKAGGFYSKEQLLHIYGIKPELYNDIKDKIYTDASIKTININVCTAEQLKNHPYINNWKIANVIINYRNKHGAYRSSDEIKKTDLVNDELYSKLVPYLVIE